jgi:hypothetical protein
METGGYHSVLVGRGSACRVSACSGPGDIIWNAPASEPPKVAIRSIVLLTKPRAAEIATILGIGSDVQEAWTPAIVFQDHNTRRDECGSR